MVSLFIFAQISLKCCPKLYINSGSKTYIHAVLSVYTVNYSNSKRVIAQLKDYGLQQPLMCHDYRAAIS